jgi:hypothetical protein
MEAPDKKQDYLAKAIAAEALAAQAADIVTRNSWLRIASGYRELATFTKGRSENSLSW